MLIEIQPSLYPGLRGIGWLVGKDQRKTDGIEIDFRFGGILALPQIAEMVSEARGDNDSWLVPGAESWEVELATFKHQFRDVPKWEWLVGRFRFRPSVSVENANRYSRDGHFIPSTLCRIRITEELVKAAATQPQPSDPPEISESLRRFRKDFPDAARSAFLMMQFGTTPAHDKIVRAVRDTLSTQGLTAVRADDTQYHDDLFPNVRTYMHGCGFGIAVFERLTQDDFNPNVSLEVGYMLAMGKPVCLLKDQTLQSLQTDLVGKLYRHFDPQDPKRTIPKVLTAWLRDKGIIDSEHSEESKA